MLPGETSGPKGGGSDDPTPADRAWREKMIHLHWFSLGFQIAAFGAADAKETIKNLKNQRKCLKIHG